MKPITAIGKIYKFGDKIQIYIQADYAELFEEHINKPCSIVVYVPENEKEESILMKHFRKRSEKE